MVGFAPQRTPVSAHVDHMNRYFLPRWSRLTLSGVAIGLAWWAHVSPQSEARLLLAILMITALIAGARHRGEWWF
jgi:hypothetical protein